MKELDGFTVERLEEILNFDLPRHPAALEEIVALARIALAAKRAEPVTWWTGPEPTKTGELESYHDHETGSHYLPLVVSLSAYNTTPQLNSPEIPEGWKLVPNMPTLGMLSVLGLTGSFESMLGRYADMLYAAPEKENG
ncbi:hypothetical protein [Yersinia mollaretii]|uniref:hypothetical protein n=1 Tax=Yersinia mollaretii TaxID=33060 RepID=UPI0011A98153|nr:hypothetical protein [Yersinia mollaretii]